LRLLLTDFLQLQALGFLFLLFSSWVAYVMFEDTEQGKTVFTSYGTTLYQMFVLFTTSTIQMSGFLRTSMWELEKSLRCFFLFFNLSSGAQFLACHW